MARAIEVRVSGRVQGVAFRAHAVREAVRLGLAGWVRNEPDESVLAHVEGAPDAVQSMVAWCRQGSPWARVEDVQVREVPPTGGSDFTVKY